MALYEIEAYEVGERIPTWTVATHNKDPLKVARRYLRFVNYCCGGPGGHDRTVSRVAVYLVRTWPDGRSLLKTVRA